ncbi:MAG: ribosome small subunit-dependent GTPase A [Eubacteriales bacterium]|nr:ribosome small subunit-dependent GTPase A [Eubacteriales bacterium]
MSFEEMLPYGWQGELPAEYAQTPWQVCRVSAEQRGLYELLTPQGAVSAQPSGALRHRGVLREDFPVVGDFVLADLSQGEAVIQAVLPRRTCLSRAQAYGTGRRGAVQLLAANFDTVLVAQALDGEISLNRLERYLAMTRQSGAQGVIVLTKADTAPYDDLLAQCAQLYPDTPALAVSARTGFGMDALSQWFAPGQTLVLTGPSGAGKSTLVNALSGAQVMKTGDVREADAQGRHTTTHRELLTLPTGAMVIDTPGIRALSLADAENEADELFADIAALAAQCRFSDCRHENEPGCAVRQALQDGTLDARRWKSYRDMLRQMGHQTARADLSFSRDRSRQGKERSRTARQNQRNKYGH